MNVRFRYIRVDDPSNTAYRETKDLAELVGVRIAAFKIFNDDERSVLLTINGLKVQIPPFNWYRLNLGGVWAEDKRRIFRG